MNGRIASQLTKSSRVKEAAGPHLEFLGIGKSPLMKLILKRANSIFFCRQSIESQLSFPASAYVTFLPSVYFSDIVYLLKNVQKKKKMGRAGSRGMST